MAMASGIGATIDSPPAGFSPIAAFFGEDQGRYLLTVRQSGDVIAALSARADDCGVSLVRIGMSGGAQLKLGNARAISVEELKSAHEGWFRRFMES
jgi:phosphoribosylformylglycinamidine synthase